MHTYCAYWACISWDPQRPEEKGLPPKVWVPPESNLMIVILKPNFDLLLKQYVLSIHEWSLHLSSWVFFICLFSKEHERSLVWTNLEQIHRFQANIPAKSTGRQGDRVLEEEEKRSVRDIEVVFITSSVPQAHLDIHIWTSLAENVIYIHKILNPEMPPSIYSFWLPPGGICCRILKFRFFFPLRQQ